MAIRPAGTPPEDGVLAVPCELLDPMEGRGLGDRLLVDAPP
ncbi:hypothetical protein [Modestobacter marinus]|nr:hypothetical protein [Modestobacter marinus]